MRFDILLETNRFNLSEAKPYFINEYSFGEDFAAWVQTRLLYERVPASNPQQEDWGWFINAVVGDAQYFIGFGGVKDENSRDPNQGEWRVMIEKRRSIRQMFLGGREAAAEDVLADLLQRIIRSEAAFHNVRPGTPLRA